MQPTCQYLTVLLEYFNCFLTPLMVSTQGKTLQISMAFSHPLKFSSESDLFYLHNKITCKISSELRFYRVTTNVSFLKSFAIYSGYLLQNASIMLE